VSIYFLEFVLYLENKTMNTPLAPRVGEVIASSTRDLMAEVLDDQEPPDFGTWVQVERPDGLMLYGLVSHIEIGSLHPNRQATAFGKTQEELRREMPQILELLRTTFSAQILAYQDPHSYASSIRQTLPPRPARLHDMVYSCAPETVCRLGKPYDFLRTLARHPDPAIPADDLIVAVLRHTYAAYGEGPDGRAALLDAGRTLSRLLNDDHERLQSILRWVL
jgi:hypothetical protein